MLKGKNIVLTGCNRGIGASMLELFACNGANIFACIRSNSDELQKKCDLLSEQFGISITIFPMDMSNIDSVKTAAKSIIAQKKPIDGLINNAGITYNALFQLSSYEQMLEVFQVNTFSPFLFTQYISKLMVRQKSGSIVNISSTAAQDANPGRSVYGASKAAISCMSKAMANELGQYNIRVNTIAPGITQTDMVDQSMTKEVINDTIASTKLGRIGYPIDIANAAMYLLSDQSSYITGQTIRVDGGLGR